MDVAGLVKVRIVADDSALDDGFAKSRQKTEAYWRDQNGKLRDAQGRYVAAGEAAKRFGNDASGAAAKAAVANDNFAGSARRMAVGIGAVRTAALAALASVSALALGVVALSDRAKAMEAQLRLVTGSAEGATIAGAKLRQVAIDTRTRLEPTVELFAKLARSTDEYGISQERLLGVTTTISQAYRVSGASAEEAANSMRQLAQGLQAGALRGDEFISVMEGAPRLARAIADGMGVSIGKLRDLAGEGKLTTDVIVKALEGQAGKIAAEFALMPATIGEAFGRIGDAILRLVGAFDKMTGTADAIIGVLNAVAEAIDFVTDNMDRLAIYAATAAAVFAASFAPGLLAAALAATSLTGAMTLLRVAIARTGVGLLVVGLGEAVYQMVRLREAMGSWSAAFEELGNRSEILLDAVVWAFRAAGESMRSIWNGALADMLRATEEAFGGILRTFGISTDSIGLAISKLEDEAKGWGEIAKSSAIIAAEQVKAAFADLPIKDGDTGAGAGGNAAKAAAEQATKAYNDLIKGAKARIDQMQFEIKTLGQTGAAAEALRFEQELLNKAMQDGTEISPAQREQISALAKQYGILAEALSQAKLKQDLLFERDQLFRSDIDAAIAAAQRGASLPIDMDSDVAKIMRVNEALRQQKEAWEDIRDTGKGVIADIVSSGVGGFKNINDLLKSTAANLAQMLGELAITNPLTNSIYGGNAPTLDSLGGLGGIFSALIGGSMPKPAGLGAAPQAVASMNVQAAMVSINGAAVGGEGGALGAITKLLNPANSNAAGANAIPASGGTYGSDLASNIRALAGNIGANPRDLAALMSFESGLRPDIWGGSGGRHYGLIQAGPSERSTYGITPGGSLADQFSGIEAYFKDRGFKPGMSGLDLYSTVNAGRPGLHNRSDTANGGTWGTVADKWNHQMGSHFERADKLLQSSNEAAAGLDKLTTSSTGVMNGLQAAGEGLENLGGGFSEFGKNLANVFPSAPGGGGSSGFGLGSFLSAFLMSPAAALNIAGGGTGLYANGGISNRAAIFGEAGPEAAVPLPDGRSIPVTMRVTGQQAEQKAPQVHISRHFHGLPAGYEPREETRDDGNGGIREDVFFDRIIAKAANRPGSATDKALSKRGAKRRAVRR